MCFCHDFYEGFYESNFELKITHFCDRGQVRVDRAALTNPNPTNERETAPTCRKESQNILCKAQNNAVYFTRLV